MKKLISLILICSLALGLTGCQDDFIDYPNVPLMSDVTYNEIYRAEVNTKLQKQRNIEPQITELYPVTDSEKIKVREQVRLDILDLIKNTGYQGSQGMHDYLKLILDNLIQTGKITTDIGTNNGYYYARVKFDAVKNPTIDEMRRVCNYIGINGALAKDSTGEIMVDEIFLSALIGKVNAYRATENRDPISTEIEQINMLEDIDADYFFEHANIFSDVATESEVVEDNSEEFERVKDIVNLFDEIEQKEEITEENKDKFGRVIRKLEYDAEEFNNIVGQTIVTEQVVPEPQILFKLNQVYNGLCGYSLYNYGETIKEVGKNRTNVELYFIYAKDTNTNEYILETIVPNRIDSNVNIGGSSSEKIISSFVKEQIDIVTESFHRAVADGDIIELTSGNLIRPQDLGISLLLFRDTVRLLNTDMWVKNIIRRENDTYLAEVCWDTDEVLSDSPYNSGKIRRTFYIRYKVQGSAIQIDDLYVKSIQCMRLPVPVEEKGVYKKISLLKNITGEVSDNLKKTVLFELSKFETGLTNRKQNDLLDDKGKVVIKDGVECYGFVSRFNTDNSVMPSKTRQLAIDNLKNIVTRYGGNVACNVSITPTEFISTDEDETQVEFFAHCLFEFANGKADLYNYYIVMSKLKDVWLIDEFAVQEWAELEKENEIKAYRENIQNKKDAWNQALSGSKKNQEVGK